MQDNAKPLLSRVINLLLDAVCVVDGDGRFVFVSAGGESIFGYTAEEMVGQPMIDFVFPEDRARTLEAAGKVASGTPHWHFRNRYVRKDGGIVHIMWSARCSDGNLRVAVARDVTELVRSESLQAAVYAISEAAHADKDLHALFRRIHEIVAGLLPVGNFMVALRDDKCCDGLTFPYADHHRNKGAVALSRPEGEKLCAEIVRSGQAVPLADDDGTALPPTTARSAGQDMFEWLGVPLRSQKGVIGALVIQHCTGTTRYLEKDQELLQFVSVQVATAIERKQAEMRLQHLALHDVLTNLPNRGLFYDRLETALARARRNCVGMALLYIDLDEFKQVNDRFGHLVGDALLRQVAQRLMLCVRESDTVGRVGGDEFVVVIDGLDVPEHASLVAEKIRIALNRSFELAGHNLRISASVGIAVYPEHGRDSEELVRYADAAMYDDKAQGKKQVRLA
jgi:diguanylate cyclase (GGDEF)-like protein/PAS domain S-box-containing protein